MTSGANPAAAPTDDLARTLWDYMLLRHDLAPADVIIALGSNDVRVGEHAARLYLRGLAPLLLCSGGLGRLTVREFERSEAETFADAALRLGVPRAAVLVEPASANTGENIDFSRALLAERGIVPSRVIAVQKPYMERRAWATFKRRWPEPDLQVASPPIPYDEYPTARIPRDLVISILVGDVQRMWVYAERGFQVPQPVPDDVRAAWRELVARGYRSHLVG
ncbi:MAG TPA: YdcF family protein [Vicinamibacterales bacterium]|nr:YdcF family protein [Vicinamibacterales bacterium]HPW20579.1 YdcF family protein [Vicinamibacterales bacterium]